MAHLAAHDLLPRSQATYDRLEAVLGDRPLAGIGSEELAAFLADQGDQRSRRPPTATAPRCRACGRGRPRAEPCSAETNRPSTRLGQQQAEGSVERL